MLENLVGKLNPEQFQAVATIDGPLLIIAGAGSGKTRVITYRIGNMLEAGIPQHQILALTFTNKAAREMAERVQEIMGKNPRALTVSTFHSFGVQVLRKHITRLGYRPNFTIYDDSDQQGLIRECAREQGISNDEIEYQKLQGLFSKIKTRRYKLSQVEDRIDRNLFLEYQERLKLYNAVDFDDLILLPVELLENDPEVQADLRNTFKYVMVDEFQDTSLLQYYFMHLITKESRNVCVVGDDDQSIYSWRGANYENLTMFEHDYPELTEIKLERNYRSTGTILEAANTLIANNKNRKIKALWTPSGSGNAIELYHLQNEVEEAGFVAMTIKTICFREHLSYDDVGVLIRTNALARNLEEVFMQENLPYKLSGGTSFFQRAEIKDIISYLRIISNPDDDISLLRIMNTPKRGIGKKTIEALTSLSIKYKVSLYRVMEAVVDCGGEGSGDLFAEVDDKDAGSNHKGAGDSYWSQAGFDARPGEKGYNENEWGEAKGLDGGPGAAPGEGGRRRRSGAGGEGVPPHEAATVPVSKATRGAMSEFLDLVEQFRPRILSGKQMAEATRRLVHEIDYWGHLLTEFESNEKIAQWRQRNIEIFCSSLQQYEQDPNNQPPSIFTYLNRVTLNNHNDEDEGDTRGTVNLMTVHASKGLEFRIVFLVGVEDGIMPHKRSLEENEEGSYEANMEEERRLFYVAITRARDSLIMTSCRTRTQMRQSIEQQLSPFLAEIPKELISVREPEAQEPVEGEAEDFFAALKDKFKPVEEKET